MDVELEKKIHLLEKRFGQMNNLRSSCSSAEDIRAHATKIKKENIKVNGTIFVISSILIIIVSFGLPKDITILVFIPLYMLFHSISRYIHTNKLVIGLIEAIN